MRPDAFSKCVRARATVKQADLAEALRFVRRTWRSGDDSGLLTRDGFLVPGFWFQVSGFWFLVGR
jgi:hypothetical protein